MNLRRNSLTFMTLSLASVLLAGCGDSGPKTIPVYGKVTTEGRPLPQVCRLYFLPASTDGPSRGPSRPSIAQMEEDGSYAVKAYKDSDGLLPGAYQVEVSYYDLKPGGNPMSEAGWIEHKHDAGELVVDADSDGVEFNITLPVKG
jgi:predicted small lipoprotein YifL